MPKIEFFEEQTEEKKIINLPQNQLAYIFTNIIILSSHQRATNGSFVVVVATVCVCMSTG